MAGFVMVSNPTWAAETYNFAENSGIKASANVAGYATGDDATSVNSLTSNIILVAISFVGIIFLVLIIYGAFAWMTSGGNSESVGKAKKTIINSTIGLIIALAAYAISYFLIGYFWEL